MLYVELPPIGNLRSIVSCYDSDAWYYIMPFCLCRPDPLAWFSGSQGKHFFFLIVSLQWHSFLLAQTTMSFTFPENDFDPNGNFIASRGPEYFMGMLNENEGALYKCVSHSYWPSKTGLSNTLQPWDDIDLDDPSLYMMLLMSDELAAVNGEPVLPHPTFIAEFSTDAHNLTHASRTPSPADSELLSEPLCDANLSTWVAWNPTRPMIHCQTPPAWLSDAQKASWKIKKGLKTEMTKHLHDAVVKHLQEQKHAVELLSCTHNVTPKYVNDMISSQTKYHTARKIHLTNALIHTKAKEMNSGMLNPFPYSYILMFCYNKINLSALDIHWVSCMKWSPRTPRWRIWQGMRRPLMWVLLGSTANKR